MHETVEYKGFTIEIRHDDFLFNPIEEFDGLGQIICFHGRYNLGHDHSFSDPSEVEEHIREPVQFGCQSIFMTIPDLQCRRVPLDVPGTVVRSG